MSEFKLSDAEKRRSSMLDRGAHIRFTPSGIAVYHFPDWREDPNDQSSRFHEGMPGHFYNEHGDEVAPQLAAEAGFDVEKLTKERKKRERIAQAQAMIEAEFSDAPTKREVVKEENGYKVVHVGNDRHNVEDPEGNVLNPKAYLDKASALKVLKAMAVPPPEEKEAAK